MSLWNWVLILFLSLALILGVLLHGIMVGDSGARLAVNTEFTSLAFFTGTTYDSWGVHYSHGRTFDGKRWKNLWHAPRWRAVHFDQDRLWPALPEDIEERTDDGKTE